MSLPVTYLQDEDGSRKHFISWNCITIEDSNELDTINGKQISTKHEIIMFDDIQSITCVKKQNTISYNILERGFELRKNNWSHDENDNTTRDYVERFANTLISKWREYKTRPKDVRSHDASDKILELLRQKFEQIEFSVGGDEFIKAQERQIQENNIGK